jgi:hypothetical protein
MHIFNESEREIEIEREIKKNDILEFKVRIIVGIYC